MTDITIKARLYLILVTVIGGFAVIGSISLYQADRFNRKIQADYALLETGMQTLVAIQAANVAFKTQVQEWKNILIRGNDPGQFDKYRKGFEQAESQFAGYLAQAQNRMQAAGSPFAADISLLLGSHRELGEKYRAALSRFDGSDAESGKKVDRLVVGMDRGTTDNLNRLVAAFEADQRNLLDSQTKTARDEFLQIRNLQLSIFLALISVCGALVWFTSWHISRQVNACRHTVAEISNTRNLSLRMAATGRDEISEIGSSVNALLQILQDAIARIKHSADAVAKYAHDMSESAAVLSNSVGQQQAATGEMAAAVEQMSASIAHISDSSQRANQISGAAYKQSEDGGGALEQTVSAMQSTSGGVLETANVVERVSRQAEEISGILQTIKDVADQTNLLALNAAIEAARAGEQGRGFAVVADEVRTLAEKTTRMTEHITQLVERIRSSARDAVSNIAAVVQGADRNVALAHRAGDAIGEIRDGSLRVVDATNTIATALAEQSVASESIARRVVQIEQMSDENNRAIVRFQGAAKQLDVLAAEMRALAAGFKA